VSARVRVTAGVVWAHVRGSLSLVGGDDLAALAGHLVLLDGHP